MGSGRINNVAPAQAGAASRPFLRGRVKRQRPPPARGRRLISVDCGHAKTRVQSSTSATARIQPALDANLTLSQRWSAAPEEVAPVALVPASGTLERVPEGLPVVTVSSSVITLLHRSEEPSSLRGRLLALGAHDIVLAVAGKTPWPAVVRLVHELPIGMRVYLAFAVDASAARVGDEAVVAQLQKGGAAAFREVARDQAQRCPAVADLFMARPEELLGVFARDAGKALRTCRCAVTPGELANVYAALLVRPYIAARSVRIGRTGATLAGGRASTFADVARSVIALPADAEVTATLDH